MKNNIYHLIGLACKAGQTSSGSEAVQSSLGRRKACMLIISSDISSRSRKELIAGAERSGVPWLVMGDKYLLGKHVGKAYRVAVTINSAGFSQAIIKILGELEDEEANQMGVVEWQKSESMNLRKN